MDEISPIGCRRGLITPLIYDDKKITPALGF